jgi:hypothetical protein
MGWFGWITKIMSGRIVIIIGVVLVSVKIHGKEASVADK